ncbi:LysR family transcriptional regulator [Paenibacillus sp. FSL W7-1287]|uniref:LysR family transcriptional regulator n=1 Tax=Paenibacillus sp. FSL W7-1287 TaxID=2954538 RepID=UPI0030F56234
MRKSLDLYRVFDEVSKQSSISKAAQELFMTQSAVSQSIQKLEKELDLVLFNRTSKGVTLTTEGKLLYEHVRAALNILNIGEEKMLEFKNMLIGELHIGVGDTISRYYLLPFLEQFYNQFPGIKLKILNGTTTEICEFIKEGKADLGVCNLPIVDHSIQAFPCKDVHDIFVGGEKYRELSSSPITLEQLVELPLICLEKRANSRVYIDRYFKEKDITLSPVFELGSHDLLLDFAKINLGVACVTKQFSQHYIDSGLLHELKLEEPIPERSIGICYSNQVPLSHAAKQFIQIVDPTLYEAL